MPSSSSTVDILERARTQLRLRPPGWLTSHGLGLFALPPTVVSREARHQARIVLAARDFLKWSADNSGPTASILLMKGLEVAQLYPSEWMRPFRDVDVLVNDPKSLWLAHVGRGYRIEGSQAEHIAHHHLQPLEDPTRTIGVDIHSRPNTPRWAPIDVRLILATAEPSRTNIQGIERPRDDLHALLLAMHYWKGGFTRLRDLLDAMLLASASTVPVADTSAQLGLKRFWNWNLRLADELLFGRSRLPGRLVHRLLLPGADRAGTINAARVAMPYFVAGPRKVTLSHLHELRTSRRARHPF